LLQRKWFKEEKEMRDKVIGPNQSYLKKSVKYTLLEVRINLIILLLFLSYWKQSLNTKKDSTTFLIKREWNG
jgi:hypothetical protein